MAITIAPFAPHLGEEMWHVLGKTNSVFDASWPTFDEAWLQDDEVEIAIQVNGRVRGRMMVAQDAAEADVVEAAKAMSDVASFVDGKQIIKTIYVPGRLLNVVVR